MAPCPPRQRAAAQPVCLVQPRRVEVWPIFYATGEVDMAAALRASGIDAAEARFRDDLAADPELGDQHVTGFVYFTLDAMPGG